MEKVLKAVNLCKRFNDQIVLDKVNLEIKSGDFVSIVGPSGSGKSTLLNVISGNDVLDSGNVFINNSDITKFNEKQLAVFRKSTLGFVYQFFNLIEDLSAYDNIMLPMYLKKEKVDKEYFDNIINDLNIKSIINKNVNQLSGGELQRVAIARSIIYKPDILMLDEPTGNLDINNRNNIMKLLKYLNEKYKITIIQVTHDIETTKYTDYVITLVDGKIKV